MGGARIPSQFLFPRRRHSRSEANGGHRRWLGIGAGRGHATKHGRRADSGSGAPCPQPDEPRGPQRNSGRRGRGQHAGRHRGLRAGVLRLRRDHHSRRGYRGAAKVREFVRGHRGGSAQIRRRPAHHQRVRGGGLLLRRSGTGATGHARACWPTSAAAAQNWWGSPVGPWIPGTRCRLAVCGLPTASG